MYWKTLSLLLAGIFLGAISGANADEQESTKPAQERSPHAEVEEVTLRVDGLACPYCAYGLEKKLKKLKGVDGFDVLINEGKVKFQWSGKKPFDFGVVEKAVDKAGYTLRNAKTGFTGSVEKVGDRFVLVPDANLEDRFFLYDPTRIDTKDKKAHKQEGTAASLGEKRIQQLEDLIKAKAQVRIMGAVHGHKGKGALPALSIDHLEILLPKKEE